MTAIFEIEGMSCGHCVMAVKKALSNLKVNVNEVVIGKAVVDFDVKDIKENEIKVAIEDAGYVVKEMKLS
ncbi:MAG: cation transporter [Bacteroidota bacterium]|nr:cation transporter [Bacteroidota bacterium]